MSGRLMMSLAMSAIMGFGMTIGPMLPPYGGPHLRSSKPVMSGPPGSRSKAERNKRKKSRRIRGKKK